MRARQTLPKNLYYYFCFLFLFLFFLSRSFFKRGVLLKRIVLCNVKDLLLGTQQSTYKLFLIPLKLNHMFCLLITKLFNPCCGLRGLYLVLCAQESEPLLVNVLRSPGIHSQPGGPVGKPYLLYQPARLYGLAESIPRSRFLRRYCWR
jgi:hypothetical protein